MHVVWLIFAWGVAVGFFVLTGALVLYSAAFAAAMVAGPLGVAARGVLKKFGYEIRRTR